MSIARALSALRLLRDLGPMTVFELSAELDAPSNSIWHLIYKLRAEGLIVPDGVGPVPANGGVPPTLWGLAPAHHPQQAPYTRQLKKAAHAADV